MLAQGLVSVLLGSEEDKGVARSPAVHLVHKHDAVFAIEYLHHTHSRVEELKLQPEITSSLARTDGRNRQGTVSRDIHLANR